MSDKPTKEQIDQLINLYNEYYHPETGEWSIFAGNICNILEPFEINGICEYCIIAKLNLNHMCELNNYDAVLKAVDIVTQQRNNFV